MTIGIAAYGPDAGRAVVRALAAVEAIGRGAIGGFVSFVAISQAGQLKRAETQRGGSVTLFAAGPSSIPVDVAEARLACVMSSGPDRPEPLSQFTPADPRVGLVTGHRMPNTIGASGLSLNEEALAKMRQGSSPREAIEEIVAANPRVDAGIIALTVDGRAHAADTAYVRKRGDSGRAMLGSAAQGAVVAVLHNAIRPYRPIASIAAEVAMDVMKPADRPDGVITFRRGLKLVLGATNAVTIDAQGVVDTIVVDDPKYLVGSRSLGIGFETRVLRNSATVATIVYEPYMIVNNGLLETADGRSELSVPIRSET